MGKKRASSEIASEEADWWTVNVLGANTGARLRGVRETDDGLRNITPLSYDSVRGVVLGAEAATLTEVPEGLLSKIWTAAIAAPPEISKSTLTVSGLPAEAVVTCGWWTRGGMMLPTPPSMKIGGRHSIET